MTKVIIPARFNSSRLPGKVLKKIGGRPIFAHVYDKALTFTTSENIFVATDNSLIEETCEALNINCIMTSPAHISGTERILEAVNILNIPDEEIIINIQGDEPFIEPQLIHQCNNALLKALRFDIGVGTLCTPVERVDDLFNENTVKVALNSKSKALYFSRAPIPFERGKTLTANGTPKNAYRHIGIYAYTAKTLRLLPNLPESELEHIEKLEQLRFFESEEINIYCENVNSIPVHGIDTEDDYQAAIQYWTVQNS